jgi:hypothetical protein
MHSRYSGKDEVMPEEKLTFVNGEPAECGCQMKFSSGSGDYSDVLYVMPCATYIPAAPTGGSESGNGLGSECLKPKTCD